MKKLLLSLALLAGFTTVNANLVNGKPALFEQDRSLVEQSQITLTSSKGLNLEELAAAPQKAPNDGQIITKQPEGRVVEYQKYAKSWKSTMGTFWQDIIDGVIATVVYGDNNEVYIKNPFTFFETGSWIKGSVDGDELVFQPQDVLADYDGKKYVYYSIRHLTLNAAQDDYELSEDEAIRFKVVDGVLALNLGKQYDAAGLWSNDENSFVGYGDVECTYSPVTDVVTELPAGVKTERFVLSRMGNTSIIELGFDGNDVYMGNLPLAPEGAWIKGSFVDGKLVIKSNQYLGPDYKEGYYKYLMATHHVLTPDPSYPDYKYYEYTIVDEVVLDYDAATRTFTNIGENTVEDGGSMVINYGTKVFKTPATGGRFIEIKIYPYVEVPQEPKTPIIYELTAYNPQYGYGYIGFQVQPLGPNGEYIDKDKLYYRLWVDNEVFTFEKRMYYDFDEDMVEIPYNFNKSYVQMSESTGIGYRYVYYFNEFKENIGVQAIYKGGGEVRKSKIHRYNVSTKQLETVEDPENGVSDISVDQAQGTDTYYDLMGNRLSQPSHGINIRRAADGKVTKIFVK